MTAVLTSGNRRNEYILDTAGDNTDETWNVETGGKSGVKDESQEVALGE